MEFVKKNLISLICAVIAIIALLAVFVWPLDGFFDSLKEKATARATLLGERFERGRRRFPRGRTTTP